LQINEPLKSQRCFFQGLDYIPLRITRLSEKDVVEHLMYINAINEGLQLSDSQIDKCRQRFVDFCCTQWHNRN